MNPVTIPVNTSRYNDYISFDRGLFKYTDNGIEKYARIAKATWRGKGDNSSPGILSYQIESFRKLPLRKEEIGLYSEGIKADVWQCITRNLMNNPIVVEGFAIASFLKGHRTLTNEDIAETHRVSEMVLATSTERSILKMDTVFEFSSDLNKPLYYTTGTVTYTVMVNGTQKVGTYLVTNPSLSTVLAVRKLNL